MKQIIKIKEHKEGLTEYLCQNCNHTIAEAKDKKITQCCYCGNTNFGASE